MDTPLMHTAVLFNSLDLPLDRVCSIDINVIKAKIAEWLDLIEDGDYIQLAVN